MKIPKDEGWYWFREYYYYDFEPVKVSRDGSGKLWVRKFDGTSYELISFRECDWGGRCEMNQEEAR